MIFNQNFLETLCLNKSAIEQLKAQVKKQFLAIKDPLIRYATARVIYGILDETKSDAGTAAEAFCEKKNFGTNGKDFSYQGLWFNRQFNLTYDYANNASDEEGNPLFYTKAVATRDKAKKSYDLSKAVVRNMEKMIELAHPNMKPKVESIVLKYQGTVEDFPN